MKNQIFGHARALLIPVLLLLITAPVLKAGKITRHSSAVIACNSLTPVNPDQQLLINLMIVHPGNVESLADGLRIRYNEGYLTSTADDILKMNNFAENISSYRENKELIVERRPLISFFDTIYLRITNTAIKDYRLKIYSKNFESNKMLAYVEDTWTRTHMIINLKGDTVNLDFSVTANPASAASNRFRVIFVSYGTLPVHFTGIWAKPKLHNVEVKWTTDNEKDIKQFDIERSGNGFSFLTIGSVLPGNSSGGSNGYTWPDLNPIAGNNYYRVRSTGLSGEIKYSDVVKAAVNKPGSGISVYPNPVTNHTLNLLFSETDKGVYSLQLINSTGQVVMKQQLKYAGGNTRQAILINAALPEGSYILVIQKPDNSQEQQALVIMQ